MRSAIGPHFLGSFRQMAVLPKLKLNACETGQSSRGSLFQPVGHHREVATRISFTVPHRTVCNSLPCDMKGCITQVEENMTEIKFKECI